eukprot:COSAG06_NODE_16746_length_983_cov_1.089367_2_plen_150_part_01
MSNDQECSWVAACAGSLAPQITFSAFDIESGWDFVYVDTDSDGSPDGAPLSGGYGGGVPDPITASANSMSILYDSDSAVNGAGFEATVSCVDPAALPPSAPPAPPPCQTTNALDDQNGDGQCASYISAGTFTCQGDFAPGGTYAGYCNLE